MNTYRYVNVKSRLSVWEVQELARISAELEHVTDTRLLGGMTHQTHVTAKPVFWRYLEDGSTLVAVQI